MTPLYHEMTQWVVQQGYKTPTSSYEYYYNGPGFAEEEMLTRVLFALER